jgi:hypothetical protein
MSTAWQVKTSSIAVTFSRLSLLDRSVWLHEAHPSEVSFAIVIKGAAKSLA